MEKIQTGAGTQFTSNEFQESIYIHGVRIELVAPDHKVEVTRQTVRTIAH